MFMGIATDKGLYEDPGRLTGTSENAPAAQPQRRPHVAPDPACRASSTHPRASPYVDPVTDRLFVTSLSADTDRAAASR